MVPSPPPAFRLAPDPLLAFALLALLLTGAIFGFFYAYSVSVMWGLDDAPPAAAIAAMQGINRVVRNAAFAPAFFGAPLALLLAAVVSIAAARRGAASWFGLAALAYLGGAFLPTMFVNIPMNEALAVIADPAGGTAATRVWSDYSSGWIVWNHLRTASSGLALLFAGAGLLALGRR